LKESAMTARPLWLVLAPFIFLVLWSGGYAVAKVALHYTQPMTLLALRFASTVALMGVLFAVLRPPLPVTRADWGHLIVVGFLIQTVYFGLSYIAFDLGVAAGTMALIMSFQPILVALVAPRWTGEAVGLSRWGGLVLALAGTVLVIASRATVEPPSWAGFAFAAVALCGITGGTLWEKRFGLSHHPVTTHLIGYAAGLLGILPLMLATEEMTVEWTAPFVAALAYLVIGNSLIAFGLLLAMIRAGEVAKVSALLFLVPPGAALIAWALIGEEMPPLAWLGMAVAGVGVWIAVRKR
jgi:drug/metabolite transporter (DMT)-like permease